MNDPTDCKIRTKVYSIHLESSRILWKFRCMKWPDDSFYGLVVHIEQPIYAGIINHENKR